jgi:RNA 2',3'-cyclic 3'-phosphodiesterase
MRLFLALPLPENVRGALAALKTDLGEARWVPPEQLHLTLRFVGETDDAGMSRLIDACSACAPQWSSIRLSIRGVGLFGTPARPRVLWAALDPIGELAALARALEGCATSAGFEPESRPFAAHVSLARFTKGSRAAIESFLREHASFAIEPFGAREVVLYRSTLSSRGAKHEALRRFPLG